MVIPSISKFVSGVFSKYSPYVELHGSIQDDEVVLVCTLCGVRRPIPHQLFGSTTAVIGEVASMISAHSGDGGETAANSAHWFREQVANARMGSPGIGGS